MAETKNGGLSRLFEKCYIDQDFEDFYQKDINLCRELSKLGLREAKAVVEKFYKDGPHNSFIIAFQTPRVCLKFLAFSTKNTRYQLRGEWIVKLRYCPHKSRLNVSLKYLEYVLVDKKGKITYIESITD